MKRKNPNSDKPERYWPNSQHPGYIVDEALFMAVQGRVGPFACLSKELYEALDKVLDIAYGNEEKEPRF